MAVCLHCSTQNPEGARFCMGCGHALAARCANCGTGLPSEAHFCPGCGTPAGAADDLAPETLKLATTLFADVVGSTAMGERLGPDELRALLAELFGALSEEIIIQGGTIEKILGDAITGVFGVPAAHEDDPCRAVSSGLRMLQRVEAMNASRSQDQQVQIRIGINTGEVSAQGSFAPQLLVVGDSVNVAARLESAAEPGTILIGERTARAVRHLFNLREVASISAKGKTEPVKAFVIEGERGPSEPGEAVPAPPLIGRTAEMERLTSLLRSAESASKPHVVTILGEPGVGKTRLVREFVERSQALTLFGRCAALEGGLTLWPFREILRDRAGLSSEDSPDVALDKLFDLSSKLPDDLVSDPKATAAALGSTIGLESALEALSGLDPREIQRVMFAAWGALFSGLARGGPLTVVIDDIHWADVTTLELLEYLSARTVGPVLFVCPARPELISSRSDWLARLRDLTTIQLGPLEEDLSLSLASHLLERQGMEPALAGQVTEKAGGNPLFIRELALCLMEGPGNGHGEPIAPGVGPGEVPDSIQAVIQARLDLLPAEERLVTQKAAVVGRFFWETVVLRITGMPTIDRAVKDLTRRQLVVERIPSSLQGETEYAFAHILIRDVAYESLPRRVRGETHAQVAAWLEQRRRERAIEFAEILAEHYTLAFDLLNDDSYRSRARAYALVAARNALRRYAVEAAESHAQRAIALSSPGTEKVEALEAVADLYLLTYRSQSAYTAYREASTEQQESDPKARSSIARLASKAALVATRWWGTMDRLPPEQELQGLIAEGLEASGAEGGASRARLLSSTSFASLLGFRFAADGTGAARTAVQLAEEAGEPDLISMTYDALAASLWPSGAWQEIHDINLRRVELIPRLRDAREICDAYGMAAQSSTRKGLYTKAARFAQQEIARAKDIDAGSYLQGLVFHVLSSFMLGDWETALRDQKEVEKMQSEPPALPGPMAMRAYVVAMFCHELRGETVEADRYLELFERYVATERERGFSPGGLPEAARMLAHRGAFARAEELLPLEGGESLSVHLEGWCELARLAQRWEAAPTILQQARTEARTQGLSCLTPLADRLEGAMKAAHDDLLAGASLLTSSAEAFSTLGVKWEEAMSRLLLAEALHRAGDPAATDQARSATGTFERLGSIREIERAQPLLASRA